MTGCWDREEVNSLAIVTSAGFDRTKDGAVELTLEIAAPRMKQSGKAQSGDKKEGGGQTIIRTAVGKTAAEAQGRLQMMLPRTIYWGQLQLVVVGEALAKNGLREQFDYLVRDNEIRLRVCLSSLVERLATFSNRRICWNRRKRIFFRVKPPAFSVSL